MYKGKLLAIGVFALVLTCQPAHAISNTFSETHQPVVDMPEESGFGYTLARAFEPYLKGTVAIRQKVYEHLLQSEEFIRIQSLIGYIWTQRSS